MRENEIATEVVDVAFRVHQRLGPGLLESVYQKIMAFELDRRGLRVEEEEPIRISYASLTFDAGFRVDLVVEDLVFVELKSVDFVHPVHAKKILTYLKLGDRRLGLLINFSERLIREGIQRIVHRLDE